MQKLVNLKTLQRSNEIGGMALRYAICIPRNAGESYTCMIIRHDLFRSVLT